MVRTVAAISRGEESSNTLTNTGVLQKLNNILKSGEASVTSGTNKIIVTFAKTGNIYEIKSNTGAIDESLNYFVIAFNANGGIGGPSSITVDKETTGTLPTSIPTREGYRFLGWGTSASATTATYQAGGTYNGSTNVTLYAVWQETIKFAAVGSYVQYTANSYSSWRIMYNNNGQLDLVSTGSVENVTLSGNGGYTNCVSTLNSVASKYVTGLATSGRSIGCTSSSQASITVGDTQASLSSSPYTDTLYVTDFNQLVNNGLVQTDKEVWLASRYGEEGTTLFGNLLNSFGCVRTIKTDGGLDYHQLQNYTKTGWVDDSSHTYGCRPVISFPSGIKIIGGDGLTPETAYQLSN